jgi:2-keto-4-pentenoate hydratase/2-oxohepta-3-ene-1,7-dioic acid hydratase in catechol pathway
MAVEAFIRFEDEDGGVKYGEVSRSDLSKELQGTKVTALSGDPFTGLSTTSEKTTVKKARIYPSPIQESDPNSPIPGPLPAWKSPHYLRYRPELQTPRRGSKSPQSPPSIHGSQPLTPTHQLNIPKQPVVFTKPPDALTGPYDDIPIHPDAQSHLDYEGELTVIIGKDVKNATEATALDCVLGYTAGNDVSARNFQIPEVSGGQHGYAKSFDSFAPIGPAVVLAAAIPDPQKLSYTTKVNGEERQRTGTDDMIWTVRQIIAHLSRGTTLRKGTVIMTGTPSGVGFFMEPKGFLKDGDLVEIEVEGIGRIANRVRFWAIKGTAVE